MPYIRQTDLYSTLRVYFGHPHPIKREDRHYMVQFHSTGTLTADDFLNCLASAFVLPDRDIRKLKVSRVDLAVDIGGVPVEWFRKHCRVNYKRNSGGYSHWEDNPNRQTTLTFGKRPDRYLVYDKVAEIKNRKNNPHHVLLVRKPGPEPVITRIERECSGRAVPAELSSWAHSSRMLLTTILSRTCFSGMAMCHATHKNGLHRSG